MNPLRPYGSRAACPIAWIDSMPAHWHAGPIKWRYQVVNGATPSSSNPSYWSGHITWVTPEDLGKLDAKVINASRRAITAEGLGSCGADLVPAGSLVLSTRAPIGHLAIAASRLCTNQGCRCLVPQRDSVADYDYYQLQAYRTQLESFGRGSTFVELSSTDLGSFPILTPPEAEQRTIATFLDHETARIDRLIEKQERLIELLKEKRQAVISHAVTKGLNPDASMKDSGIEWLGEVPAHWEVTRMRYLVSDLEQGWSPQCEDRIAEPGEYGVLKVGCVNGGAFDREQHKALPSELEPRPWLSLQAEDLLVSRANTLDLVGSAAVVPSDENELLLCDKIYRLRVVREVLPQFLSHFLGTRTVRDQIELDATGASHSMQNISQSTILELPVAIPSHGEQGKILSEIERQTLKIGALENHALTAISLSRERRSALISAAVTGKIDVRNWTPPETAIEETATA